MANQAEPKGLRARTFPAPAPAIPYLYTRELGDEVCQRVADGEPLTHICAEPGMPDSSTIYQWCAHDVDGMRDRMDAARRQRALRFADELAALADQVPQTKLEAEWLKTRINTRQWIATKLLPATYGDRVQSEQSGKLTVEIRSFREADHGTIDKQGA